MTDEYIPTRTEIRRATARFRRRHLEQKRASNKQATSRVYQQRVKLDRRWNGLDFVR